MQLLAILLLLHSIVQPIIEEPVMEEQHFIREPITDSMHLEDVIEELDRFTSNAKLLRSPYLVGRYSLYFSTYYFSNLSRFVIFFMNYSIVRY